ncbi:DUF3786 domain-containing protein [Desulfobacula phenolica]|uniref:Putative Fe-S cluster n=1 Tax=Desulfobacula phenolica TaxID=90732 RepID=A0A1H2GHL1_9BACT|nr:DUF3786 domain-containing protein [Desulfobacula phenolica]SDU19196.1 Putative Fe-S cluster [Desulfobacula phenolica]
MALSVVDLYVKVLPKTNCKECGYPTCLAFAGMVVSEKYPLKNCPHIALEILKPAQKELEQQYKEGKWLKKDMAKEALEWAKKRVVSMQLKDIASRIGAKVTTVDDMDQITLPCFNKILLITKDSVRDASGNELTRNEQTFVYIHMAQGGSSHPAGKMKSFKEFPNTVSKIVSMEKNVEIPLKKAFASHRTELKQACENSGGENVTAQYESCDLAFRFTAFPKIPVILLFRDEEDGFEADIKLLFDETIIEHLDIESIMFLSEHLCQMLLGNT